MALNINSNTAVLLVYGFASSICTSATAFLCCAVPLFRRIPVIHTFLCLNLVVSYLFLSILSTPMLTYILSNELCRIIFEQNVQYAILLLEGSLMICTVFPIQVVKMYRLPQINRFSGLLVLKLTGTIWAIAVYAALCIFYLTSESNRK